MGKALAALALAIALVAIATRADCEGLSQSDCERVNAMIDGAID